MAPASGEQIKWQVIASGGGSASSVSYRLTGTLGQTAASTVASVNYRIQQGFWQNFSAHSGCCVGEVGDIGPIQDGVVDLTDLQVYIDYLFFGGATATCLEEFDAAGNDGTIDISDLQAIVDYLFFGGSLPACP
jgi:hypothetical protein